MVIAFAALVILHPARARGEFLHFTANPSASDISATVLEPMSSFSRECHRQISGGLRKIRVFSGEVSSDAASSARTTSVERGLLD
jgi:hypothetical protein